ncbi:MAG: DNA primase [Saprospiraceae bacterium]|nr:DNA primase [Saprospiraceae bacterium]
MISKKSVDDVLQTAKVEEVISDYVNLKKSGSNLLGLCPFHHEKTPSFSVSPSKNIYKCFGCGKAGGPVQFIMEHESSTFPEAVKYLAKKYNISIEEITESKSDEAYQEELKRESYSLINEFANNVFQESLFQHPQGKTIGLAYFKERGFLESTIKKFSLGFAPDQKNFLAEKCITNGYNADTLKELGLLNKNNQDFFSGRVIFPITNISGKVIAFSGRKLSNTDFGPKYINSPETPLYIKSKVLYGLHLAKAAIRSKDECLLVEGYTDVISMHQAGIQHVVASSGTSLTVDQIRLIKRFTPNIKIVYDGDEAGIKATMRALDMILEENMNVRMAILPTPEDPDSFLKKNGSSAFESFLQDKSVDFVLFKASLIKRDTKNDPIKKSEGITDIIQTISKIPDAIKRSTYIQVCAEELAVSEEVLIRETNRMIKKDLISRRSKQFTDQERSVPNPAQDDADYLKDPQHDTLSTEEDEYQERSLIRVLILYGHLMMDAGMEKTLAQYINENMDNLEEEFNNKLYERILKEYIHQLSENRVINTDYFIGHADPDIRNLTIELSTSPFNYSHNWADRWEMELQTQKPPDENYVNDCYQSILRFKLKKVQKMIKANKLLLDSTGEEEMQQLIYLKTQHELLNYRNTIADLLGMRVFS